MKCHSHEKADMCEKTTSEWCVMVQGNRNSGRGGGGEEHTAESACSGAAKKPRPSVVKDQASRTLLAVPPPCCLLPSSLSHRCSAPRLVLGFQLPGRFLPLSSPELGIPVRFYSQ